jgi:hypothetical protein
MNMSKNETHKEKMKRKKMERKNHSGIKSVSQTDCINSYALKGESSSIKPKGKIKMNKVSLSEVVTPTTVEEFRENLSRFFLKDGGTNNLMVMGHDSIPIEKLSSFDDIYTITGTGFSGDGSSPSITPTVDFSMDQVKEFMTSSGQFMSCGGFFENEDNFTLYDDQSEFVQNAENVSWYTLDNKILRGFYSKVLGEFSGYRGSAWVDDTRSKYIGSMLGKKVA